MRFTDERRANVEEDLAARFGRALDYVQRRVVEQVQTAATTIVAAGTAQFEWDESLHPRDDHGRFGEGSGDSRGDGSGSGERASFEAVLSDQKVADILTGKTTLEQLGHVGYQRNSWGMINVGDVGDPVLDTIAQVSGAAGKPTVVSRDEMDKAVAAGAEPLYRGVTSYEDQKTGETVSAAQVVDTLRNGEQTRWGGGQHGNGIYFSKDETLAADYSGINRDSAMVRAVFKPDANVVGLQQVKAEQAEFIKANYDPMSRMSELLKMPPAEADKLHAEMTRGAYILGDFGAYAMAAGYDAIVVDGRDPAIRGTGEGEVVVLNRAALLVEGP